MPTTVTLNFERLGRRPAPPATEVRLPDLKDEAFLGAIAEAVYVIARRRLVSREFEVHATFDDDSTHAGSFEVEAGRFGRGRWELT